MAPANYTAIEDALQSWVVRASGYAGARVIWADQSGNRPKGGAFVELRLDGLSSIGLTDESTVRDNPVPAPGEEILIETSAHTDFTITVQVYTSEATGNGRALVVANRIKNWLSKESEIALFEESGVAIVDAGTVQNTTALLDSEFESRATFDVACRVLDGTTETATFIESVEADGEFH